ncbi:MAG TPA: urea ABC transporter ATP-binding subunit UrtE [Thermoleophilaceae bacterium]|nr:urea ABC transporter ATP-binding subunit UrtE [Thermoleophilaceae bacterium]
MSGRRPEAAEASQAALAGAGQEHEPLFSVEDLEVAYDRTSVVFGVSFEVGTDGLVCLMGRNGVGKSTVLSAIMGLLPVRSGSVNLCGQDITRLAPYERVRAGLAYVPQERLGFPHLTVLENLVAVLEATAHRDPAAIDDALEVFPRLKPLLSRPAGFLSGGQQQQLAIARALVTRPRLLLLDEPTEGIQPSIILEVEEAIEKLHAERGMSILLVEQYVEFALRLADSYVVLDAGAVAAAGDIATLEEERVRGLLSV